MSQYEETLARFQRYILDEDTSMEAHVVGEDLEFRQTRLNVYHNGYTLRLLETLEKCYPALVSVIGEELFETIAREYIAADPSRHFCLSVMCERFSHFLSTHSSVDPIFAELAEFESTLDQVLGAADGPHLTFDQMVAALAPEDWANLILELHPSLVVRSFHYPIPAFWQHLVQEKEKPELVRLETPAQWLIWRFNMRGHFCPMSENQAMLLKLLQAGKTFSEICGDFTSIMPEDEIVNFVAGTIRSWVDEGIFSAYQISAA